METKSVNQTTQNMSVDSSNRPRGNERSANELQRNDPVQAGLDRPSNIVPSVTNGNKRRNFINFVTSCSKMSILQ